MSKENSTSTGNTKSEGIEEMTDEKFLLQEDLSFEIAPSEIVSTHELKEFIEGGIFTSVASSSTYRIPDDIAKEIKEKYPEIEEVKEKKNNKVDYTKLPQVKHTNDLAHNLTRNAEIDMLGNGKIVGKDYEITLEGIEQLKQSTDAVVLLDLLTIISVQTGRTLAEITLDEYLNLRNIKKTKNTQKDIRKRTKENMELFKQIEMNHKGTGKKRGDWENISLYGGKSGVKNGIIFFRFSEDYYKSINKKQFAYIPRGYFKINYRLNPHTTYFLRRIIEHKRINIGDPTENIIGVETLKESSPSFPKYETLVKKKFTERILKPFERDMDQITKITQDKECIKWHYCGKNGSKTDQPTTYEEFIKLNVKIEWNDYINTTKLESSRKKGIRKAVKNKNQKKEIEELKQKVNDLEMKQRLKRG